MIDYAGFAFSGDAIVQRYINGVLDVGVIETKAVDIETAISTEVIERKSYSRVAPGAVAGSFPIVTDSTVKISFGSQNGAVMGFFMLANKESFNIASGVVVAESVVTREDEYVRLAHDNISNPVVVGSNVDVDFMIDPVNGEFGMFMALQSGNIASGATVDLAYEYGSITGNEYKAGTVPKIDLLIDFKGRNLEDGSQVEFRIHKATMKSGAAIKHITKDAYEIPELEGSLVLMPDQTELLTYKTNVVYG